MKKKYLVYCLALSMALSVPTPIFAAEQIEVAENSNVDSESCEESEEIIVPVDSENLEIEDESTEVGSFTEDVENSNSAEDDSVVLLVMATILQSLLVMKRKRMDGYNLNK